MAGTFTWLQVQKAMVRHAVKQRIIQGMDRHALTFFRFSKEEANRALHWHEDHEFEYRGHMYDVVERREAGGIIELWCWDDKEESAIEAQLSSLSSKLLHQNQERRERQQQVISFLKSLYHVHTLPELPAQRLSAKAAWQETSTQYQSLSLSPAGPPPRLS